MGVAQVLVRYVRECQENALSPSEWTAVRDRIVQPTIMNFLHYSRTNRVGERSRHNTTGIFMSSFLRLRDPPSSAPSYVLSIAKVFQRCIDGKSIMVEDSGSTGTGTSMNEKKKRQLQKEVSALQKQKDNLTKAVDTGTKRKAGSTSAGSAFLMTPRSDEFNTLCEKAGLEEESFPCGQQCAYLLRPKGPKYANGASACTGCDKPHPASAADVKTTYGHKFFDAMHEFLAPFAPSSAKKKKKAGTPK